MYRFLSFSAFTISILFCSFAAFAVPGDLDPSFGTGGKVVTKFHVPLTNTRLATPEAIIVQPDGKTILAGMARDVVQGTNQIGAALVRYNVDGSLDTTFSGDGRVVVKVVQLDTIHALALQPDGKIIATGLTNVSMGSSSNFAFLVMRFNPDGSLDTTFNGTGYVVSDWTSGLDEAVTCAIQSDGKILAGGFVNAGTGATDFAMARYNANGSLDTPFGNGGLVRTDFAGTLDGAHSMVLMPNAKIILAGAVWNDAASSGDFALIGYNANGTIDMNFGANGKVRTDIDGQSQNTFDFELTTDNKLLLTGVTGQPGFWNIAAVRYNSNGTLDASFDGDGKFVHNFPGNIEGGVAIKTQSNGKIVIAADVAPDNGAFDFAALRLHPNGSVDTSFGDGGRKFIDFGNFTSTTAFANDSPTDMWIGPDGKIVIGGDTELEPNMTHDFAVARLLGDPMVPARPAAFDFDGDRKTDISIFRPSAGEWWLSRSLDGASRAFRFGTASDQLVPADFTGDGKTDIAFFRPSTGQWFVLRSEDSSFFALPFGADGDRPVPADYDGDGNADPAVFRPSAGTWYVARSLDGQTSIMQFGSPADKPVVGDYDADGKADIAVIRQSGPSGAEWWIRRSSDGSTYATVFGAADDRPVPADFTGDGKTDIAFWRPSTGVWYVLRSEDNSFYAFPFGAPSDMVAPGDYDGDGKADAAVFRPSTSTWFVQRSADAAMIIQFGAAGDTPVPSAYVP
jgi:uncharacterized delta-60 repeat protein